MQCIVETSFVLCNALIWPSLILLSDPPIDEVCVGAGNDSAIPCSTKFLPTIEDYTDLSEFTL
jgi:hypothetical protein